MNIVVCSFNIQSLKVKPALDITKIARLVNIIMAWAIIILKSLPLYTQASLNQPHSAQSHIHRSFHSYLLFLLPSALKIIDS